MKWIAASVFILNVLYWVWSCSHRPVQNDDENNPVPIAGESVDTKNTDESTIQAGKGTLSESVPIKSLLSGEINCYQIGPFLDSAVADSYLKRITRFQEQGKVERQREPSPAYRVQTKFYSNKRELSHHRAMLLASKLRAKPIKDKLGRQGWSLGLFYEEAEAVSLFRRARKAGLNSITIMRLPKYRYIFIVKLMNVQGPTTSVRKYLHSLVYPPSKPIIEKISCK